MDYPGYRVSLNVIFGKMKDKIQIDIGVGDIVKPENKKIDLFEYKGEAFFEGDISLQVYPLESIFAEKLETIVSKGAGNSRMKDYHDLFLIVREDILSDRYELNKVIKSTFQNRRTVFQTIKYDDSDLSTLQKLWHAHYRGLGKVAEELNLPQDLKIIIATINHFLCEP
jgi:predicted nucleotidyltransferase component of viral defense system